MSQSILVSILGLIIAVALYTNCRLVVSRYRIELDHPIDGVFTIVHLSDSHSRSFGRKDNRLVRRIRAIDPDLIVMTGDMIGGRSDRVEKRGLFLAGNLAREYPVCYVSGNHEASTSRYRAISDALDSVGVAVLENRSVTYGPGVAVLGVSDLLRFRWNRARLAQQVRELTQDCGDAPVKILLSHRPHLIDVYEDSGVDLVLSGHAHGGQIRIPGVGGLVAPDQGWFPKYTAGVHQLPGPNGRTTHLVISRGLGGPLLALRLFNPPEVVVVEIKTQPQP